MTYTIKMNLMLVLGQADAIYLNGMKVRYTQRSDASIYFYEDDHERGHGPPDKIITVKPDDTFELYDNVVRVYGREFKLLSEQPLKPDVTHLR